MAKDGQISTHGRLDLLKRRSTINLVVVAIAFAIALASVYFTRIIVEQLKERELNIITLYAKSLEFTITNQNSPTELAFAVENIINPNNSIPVIQTNGFGQVQATRNIEIDPDMDPDEVNEFLNEILEEMKLEYDPIEIPFRDENGEVFSTAYRPSLMDKLHDAGYRSGSLSNPLSNSNTHFLNLLPYCQLTLIIQSNLSYCNTPTEVSSWFPK